ncbi:MAG TPA: glycosyltransferase [Candidatus Limnocylindria bacterium]|nr:glycosyltransferase [Candidatus Limnocylindria bacterium]
MRAALGVGDEVLVLHSSNLRAVKRIDVLLAAAARIQPRESFKLLILAGSSFAPFHEEVRRLGLEDRIIVREKVNDMEQYLPAADLGLVTSDSESFCLSILEAMFFGHPSVATRVGGIPEVVTDGETGVLAAPGDAAALAKAASRLIQDPAYRRRLGASARHHAYQHFSADAIVPQYEALYRRVCGLSG